jgi:hypothetical protein
MSTRLFRRTAVAVLSLFLIPMAIADPVPTTIDDFFLPGSQPNQSGTFKDPTFCDNCHGGYDQNVEPAYNWRGGMMAQAARDPLYLATLAIANQDAPESGDLCIRCHAPVGWLEGRSLPTDGSALNDDDREGVQCGFCHRMVKPAQVGVNPYPDDPDYTASTYLGDQTYIATLDPIPEWSANGMYIADSQDIRRGPYVDAPANHGTYYSPFHFDAALCGTCHDVSNPAFSHVEGFSYVPNAFGQQAPDFDPQMLFPVERTFSEWNVSAYNTPGGIYAPQFGGNKDHVSTCQDCHLRDVTGKGCNKNNAPVREDLPLHDMTGGNTFVPTLLESAFPGETNLDALNTGIQRALYMLQNAATMMVNAVAEGDSHVVHVHVINETGHKLPSGYPEGRRMWLHVQAYDSGGELLYESGAYDSLTATLFSDPDIKIYEIKPGISSTLAPVVNLPPGPSFHFVLNDTVYKDNRIPPRGFTNAAFAAIQSPPIGYSYSDSQYWDDTLYQVPSGTDRVDVTLYYQTTSKEYIEFLRDENVTDTWGETMYTLWEAHGMSPPVTMATAAYDMPQPFTLTVKLIDSTARLTWSPCADVGAFWIYGASNNTHFIPGFAPTYDHRLAVLPADSLSWSTSIGIGDTANEWTFLVMGVDSSEQELCHSNRAGEREFLLP